MKTAILLPSHRKPQYVTEAVASVLNQTYQDFTLFLIDDRSGEKTRKLLQPYVSHPNVAYVERDDITSDYRPARFANELLQVCLKPIRQYTYYAFHADDDLWEPTYLESLVGYLDQTGEAAAYGWCRRTLVRNGQFLRDGSPLQGSGDYGPGQQQQPLCQIDGGQVVIRIDCLLSLPEPWFLTDRQANLTDGLFLNRWAERFWIRQVPEWVCTKQLTELSTHDQGGWI